MDPSKGMTSDFPLRKAMALTEAQSHPGVDTLHLL
jgi:hypothetical protein